MAAPRRIVVVGGSLAGARAIQGLRDRGFAGELALIGAELHLPYDRPPLSKSLLAGSSERAEHALLGPADVEALQLELHLGVPAARLHAHERRVELADGRTVGYEALIIATGCAPRMPEQWGHAEGVHVLRTLDDCLMIRDDLRGAARVAVIGAGFIGCEVAATARMQGLDVTLIDPLPAPLALALGERVGEICAALHEDAGVDVRRSTRVEAVEGAGRVERVRLSTGELIEADVVVVGIGVRPATDWLAGSGVAVGDGVLCDSRCRTSVPGVYAAGDVARWNNPVFGAEMRVEHWTNASEQGAFVAKMILDGDAAGEFGSVPFVWSEQYDTRIEIAGRPAPEDRVHIIEGSAQTRPCVAAYERDGRLSGVVAFDAVRQMLRFRRMLAAGVSWAEVEAGVRAGAR